MEGPNGTQYVTNVVDYYSWKKNSVALSGKRLIHVIIILLT